MNAVNPVQSPSIPSPDGAEPSMEEILASIRKIIADDGVPARLADARHEREPSALLQDALPEDASPHGEPFRDELIHEDPVHAEPTPAHEPAEYLHEPAEYLVEEPSAMSHVPPPEGPMAETMADLPPHPLAPAPDVAGLGAVEHAPRLRDTVHDTAPSARVGASEHLLSAAAESSVASAFNTLAASRFVDNSEQFTGLVREMIRPLVKAWVDEHLPGLVERLVVAEIERMARG